MEKLLCSLSDCPDEFFFVAQIMQIEMLSKYPDKPDFRHQVRKRRRKEREGEREKELTCGAR